MIYKKFMIDYQLISLVAIGVAAVGIITGYLDLGLRRREEQREAKKIETEAQERAEKVLRQAQDKALEILEKTRIDVEARSQKLDDRLDRAEEKEIQDFGKALVGITTDLQGEAATVVGQKVDEEFARVKLEIEGYKAQKLKEIDAKASEIIKDVTRQVLGKALDTAKHSALVAAALEEAKIAHVL